MWKAKDSDICELKEDILMDTGLDLKDLVAEYYAEEGTRHPRGEPYDEARITFCTTKKIVGSEDWAPFTVNKGWDKGTFPNLTAIAQWVRHVKDNGANSEMPEYKVKQEAYLVARHMAEEGIIPTWFVDKAIERFIL